MNPGKNSTIVELRKDIVHSEIAICKILDELVDKYGYLEFSISTSVEFLTFQDGRENQIIKRNVDLDVAIK